MTGADVRRVRDHLRLTQVQLAALLGVHAVTVSNWERGRTGPGTWQAGVLELMGAGRRPERQLAAILHDHGAPVALAHALREGLHRSLMRGRSRG